MIDMDPRAIIAIGFVLVLLGFVVPFLMVAGFLKSSLVLSFASYAASTAGVFLGLIGGALYIRREKGKRH
jgi:glucan phosphoethanolaminetransferase (alkaline phosphatase superfamily)